MVNQKHLQRELEQLDEMLNNYHKFQEIRDDESRPHYEKQIAAASLVALKEWIDVKARDIRRRLKGS